MCLYSCPTSIVLQFIHACQQTPENGDALQRSLALCFVCML